MVDIQDLCISTMHVYHGVHQTPCIIVSKATQVTMNLDNLSVKSDVKLWDF